MEIDLRLVEIRSIIVSYEEFKRRPPEESSAATTPAPEGDWMDSLPEKE